MDSYQVHMVSFKNTTHGNSYNTLIEKLDCAIRKYHPELDGKRAYAGEILQEFMGEAPSQGEQAHSAKSSDFVDAHPSQQGNACIAMPSPANLRQGEIPYNEEQFIHELAGWLHGRFSGEQRDYQELDSKQRKEWRKDASIILDVYAKRHLCTPEPVSSKQEMCDCGKWPAYFPHHPCNNDE